MNDGIAERRPEFVPGVFYGMPAEDYHAIEGMSSSGSGKMLKSPAHFRLMRTRPNQPTPTMQFGTAVHEGTLEPDSFAARVVAAPEVNKRTKDGKADFFAFAEANAGRIILSTDDFARAQHCIEAVRSHPGAIRLLAGAEIETSLFWIDGKYKVPCKARIDIRSHGGITDLKTTSDASPEDFAKSIANFGYMRQAAHYFSGHEHALDRTPEFFAFIAVESVEPYAVACYEMPSNGILAGAHEMDIVLERYAAALAAGRWPGYPETIETITLPRWATSFNR